ncbi:MAG TPA: DUF4157 domain-containing protein [Acidimicrobiales bacterium]|nr:DUF4157 domain-containing protein [Acidimicrobiales bacterium]
MGDTYAFGDRVELARSGGSELAPRHRRRVEAAFGGADLSRLRVHTGVDANALARTLGASAFTTGADVFFRAGAFAPDSDHGFERLIHEATHVLQQAARGTDRTLGVSDPGDREEAEARHGHVETTGPPVAPMQRSTDDWFPMPLLDPLRMTEWAPPGSLPDQVPYAPTHLPPWEHPTELLDPLPRGALVDEWKPPSNIGDYDELVDMAMEGAGSPTIPPPAPGSAGLTPPARSPWTPEVYERFVRESEWVPTDEEMKEILKLAGEGDEAAGAAGSADDLAKAGGAGDEAAAVLGGGDDLARAAGMGDEVAAATSGLSTLGKVANVAGAIGGVVTAGKGVYDIMHAKTAGEAVYGGVEAGVGTVGTLGAAGTLLGSKALASLNPAGAVAGAGLAGFEAGKYLEEHTRVGEIQQTVLGSLDQSIYGSFGTTMLEQSEKMGQDFSEGGLGYVTGAARGLGMAGVGALGAVGSLAGGAGSYVTELYQKVGQAYGVNQETGYGFDDWASDEWSRLGGWVGDRWSRLGG